MNLLFPYKNLIFICLLLSISGFLFANDTINNQVLLRKVGFEKYPNYSGDKQYEVVGEDLDRLLKVQVIDSMEKPVKNYAVRFELVSIPKNATGFKLQHLVFTDTLGIASTHFTLGDIPGEYEVVAKINSSHEENIQIFKVYARKKNWLFFLIIGLFGGLGLFLLGMRMMSNGMQKSAGEGMRSILSKLTYNRFVAMGVGTFVTMIIQSSSATTVMLVSFVNSRLMRFRQTIGIILGAAIGTTITAQIIAFKLTDYALLFIGLGFAIQLIFENQKYKNVGESILGFGVLFFGMHVMSEAMYPLRSHQPFIDLLLELENPVYGILIGAIFTALIQSSSAFIGIMIILGGQGFLSMEAGIPLLIGANLGTAITAVLASLNASRESKQVAIAHTLFKVVGVLLLIWWIPGFSKLIESISPSADLYNEPMKNLALVLPRQIANAHTVYNIILALLFIPFVKPFANLVNLIFPVKPEVIFKPKTKYLDYELLKTPALAISVAKQETLRLIKIVRKMTEAAIVPFMEKNMDIFKWIDNKESEVNFIRDELKEYLIKITQLNVDSERVEEAFQMLFAVKEFEHIGDIISKNFKKYALAWTETDCSFTNKGKKELLEYHANTVKQINRAYELYEDFNLKKAKKIQVKYEKYREMSYELEKQHYLRLQKESSKALSSSKIHIEVLTLLKLINSHTTNTARIISESAM